ncbi:MAG: imidazole glycerol phosphate synthase subunit HisF [Bacteroidota bacterium]|jgi:cyclase|nr:imidazole glycerol phosphate synthase subunit HisF [Bacteroidota bacterium]MCA6442044.1 imidazole glycerol phosphate synthase subunit HisF [Bacteroidota bacterium]
MLKKRLIPKLLLKPMQFGSLTKLVLVTTVGFDKTINAGDPVSQAKIYEAQAADELIFINIDSENASHEKVIQILNKISEEIFMPITIGGGINSLNLIREYLKNGADKIAVNTYSFNNPDFIKEASDVFGAQCIVCSIDYKIEDSEAIVYINNGKTKTNKTLLVWAKECESLGAGELLITNIDHDGSHLGLDLAELKNVCNEVKIPVIASGGCGVAKHFIEGFEAGADAVSAGTYFCFKDQNPIQTRSHIANANIPIRLHQ